MPQGISAKVRSELRVTSFEKRKAPFSKLNLPPTVFL